MAKKDRKVGWALTGSTCPTSDGPVRLQVTEHFASLLFSCYQECPDNPQMRAWSSC